MSAKVECAYLYADGHAVLLYEKSVRLGANVTRLEYAVIHEKWTDAHLSFKGRLVFSRGGAAALLALCKQASAIRAVEKSVEHGSQNSKAMGVAVGSLSFDMKSGGHLYFYDLSILSGQFTYQPEIVEVFDASARKWSGHPVSEIKLRKAEVAA